MAESFGHALRQLRESAGLSQRELAGRVPLSQSSLSRYEANLQECDPAVAERLDKLLDAGGALLALLPAKATDVLTDDDRARIAHSMKHPSRIDGETVSALAALLAAQHRLDDKIGPALVIPPALAQMEAVTQLLRAARGPHRATLAEVAAEYVQFAGWLHAETRRDQEATRLLTWAEELADDAANGPLAAQVMNFRGYLARQQQNPRAVVRWFLAAYHTPHATAAQRMGDAAQAAQGYAQLGEHDMARRLLDVGSGLFDAASREEPPACAYWLTPTFQRLGIGLAHLSLGDYGDAVDHLSAGLDGLPPDQSGAEWTLEYRRALEVASESR